jgi:hypothetical protein
MKIVVLCTKIPGTVQLSRYENIPVNGWKSAGDQRTTRRVHCRTTRGGAQVTCPATCNTGTAMTYVQVSVTIPFTPIFNYPGIPNPINITQVACARVQ